MRSHRISALESVSPAGTGLRLVGTQVTETPREVAVPMPPHLLAVCVPVETEFYSTKDRWPITEAGHCFEVVGVVVFGVVAIAILRDLATGAGSWNGFLYILIY